MDLVGRGKVGLALLEEAEQLVAIDGQPPMLGSAPAATIVDPSATDTLRSTTAPTPAAYCQQAGAAGTLQPVGWPAADGENGGGSVNRRPGSLASIRLMKFGSNWEKTIGLP